MVTYQRSCIYLHNQVLYTNTGTAHRSKTTGISVDTQLQPESNQAKQAGQSGAATEKGFSCRRKVIVGFLEVKRFPSSVQGCAEPQCQTRTSSATASPQACLR